MSLKMRLFTLSIITLLSLPVSQSTYAQTQIENVPEKYPSFFQRDAYTVEFRDEPLNSISKFTMRIASFGQASGCASMTKSKVTTKDALEAVSIEVKDSEIKLDNKKPRYSNHDCEIKQQRSFFDVVLDRDDMINKGIKQIKLTSEKYGEFNSSDVEVSEEKFVLKIKTGDGNLHLTHWFFPENTVILSTPYAKSDADTRELIEKFAKRQGLLPAAKHFEGYIPPHHVKNHAIFIDRWNRVMQHLDNPEEQNVIGSITPTRTVYGVNGPVEEEYNLDVYAKMPKQGALLVNR